MLRITDFGVGISSKRLIGMTNVGYSTKRSANVSLGAFGLGSKSPLATGVQCFNITTRHNGRKYSIDVYDFDIVNRIPLINFATGEKNECVLIEDGEGGSFELYYEKTKELNGTTISIPVKKNNRSKVTDTVESTLRFFNTVKFFYKSAGQSNFVQKDFLAKILYQTQNLVVTADSDYSVVNLALVRDPNEANPILISYGPLDFGELDMTPIKTPVTLVMPYRSTLKQEDGTEIVLQEGISVTPNRENIIYDENTIEFIKKHLKEKAQQEVQNLVDELQLIPDFAEWWKFSTTIKTSNYFSNNSKSYVAKLVPLINVESLNMTFGPKNGNEYAQINFNNMSSHLNTVNIIREFSLDSSWNRKLNKNIKDVKRLTIYDHNSKTPRITFPSSGNIVIGVEQASKIKDLYLFDKIFQAREFTYIQFSEAVKRTNLNPKAAFYYKKYVEAAKEEGNANPMSFELWSNYFSLAGSPETTWSLYNALLKSKNVVVYDDVIVPESFKLEQKQNGADEILDDLTNSSDDSGDTNGDSTGSTAPKRKQLTLAQIRKLNEEVLVYCYDTAGGTKAEEHKVVVPNKRLINCKTPIIYGSADDAEKLSYAAELLSPLLNNYSLTKYGLSNSVRKATGKNPSGRYVTGVCYSHTNLTKTNGANDEDLDVPFPYIFRASKDNIKYLERNPYSMHVNDYMKMYTVYVRKNEVAEELDGESSKIPGPGLNDEAQVAVETNVIEMNDSNLKNMLTAHFITELLNITMKGWKRYVKEIATFEPALVPVINKLEDFEKSWKPNKQLTSLTEKVILALAEYNIFTIKNKVKIQNNELNTESLLYVLHGYLEKYNIDTETFSFDSSFEVNMLNEEIIELYLQVEEYLEQFHEIYAILDFAQLKEQKNVAVATKILNAVKNGLI